jgi:glycosyl-4,4'-diaponeurosporenoate acyltransferase
MPLVHLTNIPTVIVDIAVWGAIHAGTGYLVHRLPDARFELDTALSRPRRWERGGRFYERLAIRRWKDRLPEAGDVFAGGVSKRSMVGRSDADLRRFAVETRRAELGHVLAAVASPVFVLWNTVPVTAVMIVYGVVVNAPFIAIQRYNRLRIARVLARRSSTSSSL